MRTFLIHRLPLVRFLQGDIIGLRPTVLNYCARGSFASYSPIAGSKRQLSSTIGCLVQLNTVGRRQRLSLFAYREPLIRKDYDQRRPQQKRIRWMGKIYSCATRHSYVCCVLYSNWYRSTRNVLWKHYPNDSKRRLKHWLRSNSFNLRVCSLGILDKFYYDDS